MDQLVIKGARQHNLKNINLTLPKNKLIVFSGISGSGKSSLAFDTIYAEGQRRYIESLSSYARQFLGIMNKPEVDIIEGLSPAIAIAQKSKTHNPRSTVGTVTEIYDYLRLLYARIGHPHCPICGREIVKQSVDQITDKIMEIFLKEADLKNRPIRAFIFSPVVQDRKGEFNKLFENLKAKGYNKARIDGQIYDLFNDLFLIKTNRHTIEIVVDKISLAKKQLTEKISLGTIRGRIFDSIARALAMSEGLAVLSLVNDASFDFPQNPKKFVNHLFSERFACPVDNLSLGEIEPRTFSFNSPHGACSTCSGIGSLLKINPEILINPSLTISEGGILPYSRIFEKETWYARLIIVVCERHQINPRKPLSKLTMEQKKILLYGYADNINELMSVSDIIITKPGGVTTAEALAKKMAMIIVKPIPGQEVNNTADLMEMGAAVKAGTAKGVRAILEGLLSDRHKLAGLRNSAEKISKPNASFDIARLLLEAAGKSC